MAQICLCYSLPIHNSISTNDCSCYCHVNNSLRPEIEKLEEQSVSIDMIVTMRQAIEAWQNGYEVLINTHIQRIDKLERQVSDLCDIVTKIANYCYAEKPDNVYKCVVCDGSKKKMFALPNGGYFYEPCDVCEGKGVLWK